ncbi:MAG: hypothetical protein WC847_00275 [Candidatus Paceibacterota bacterium]|jgi:hypothetical protein
MKKNNLQKNKGFVILFAVTLAAILLSIALGVGNIALKEIKFGTSAKDTNDAFFAADAGVECARINDKFGGVAFKDPPASSVIQCNNTSINVNVTNGILPVWDFVISGLGNNGKGCAKVSVDKRISPNTTVISKGYNNGSGVGTCNPSSNSTERELSSTYGGGVITAVTLAPIFVRSSGVSGTSFSFDIGTAGTNRLIVIMASNESNGTNLTNATVDGKNCNFVVTANNINGTGNHSEMWYCDEDNLGSSSGVVTVAISGGSLTWGVHAHLYTGAGQAGPTDFGIDNTSTLTSTTTVNGIDVLANGLVVMSAANGSSGTYDTWTSPLTERTDGPNPSSAVLATASDIEITSQTNKTYIATASLSANRSTGIVASWPAP